MTGSQPSLSWSALLVGWPHGEPSVTEITRLAEERTVSASGSTLVALSELASLRGDESRADVTPHLTTLAAAENWPPYFEGREWQLRRLAQALGNLDDVRSLNPLPDDVELPGLAAHLRSRSLEDALTSMGLEAQTPVVIPLLHAVEEHGDLNGALTATAAQLRAWIEGQWRFLGEASVLRGTGPRGALWALAQGCEDAQGNHALHMEQVRAERATHDTDSVQFPYIREGTGCTFISRNPYFLLLPSVGFHPAFSGIQSESV